MTSTPSTTTPKYVMLAEQLRDQIDRGMLKPGDRLPSFVEMRTQYGVTPTTVERVYARLEKDNLVVRKQGLGTFVKQRLERVPTGVIGVSGASLSYGPHVYYATLFEGLHKVAAQAGFKLLLFNDEEAEGWQEKVDGVFIYDTSTLSLEKLLRQIPSGMPCVAATLRVPGYVSVVADEYQGAYDIAQHLIALGHRRIAFVRDRNSRVRFGGYRDALSEAGIEVDERFSRLVSYFQSPLESYVALGRAAMRSWLQEDWDALGCTAIITQNDETAIGVVHALAENGRRVPDHVSVVGFDGTEIGQHFRPEITSVEVPLAEIGVTAMRALLRQIGGERMEASTIVLPTRVLSGGSVAQLSGGDTALSS